MNETKPQELAEAELNSGKKNVLKPNASSQVQSLHGFNVKTTGSISNFHKASETNPGSASLERKIEVVEVNENKPNVQLQTSAVVSNTNLTNPKLDELNSSVDSGKTAEVKSDKTKESPIENTIIANAQSTNSSTNTTFINKFVIPTLEQNPRISGVEFFRRLKNWDGETTVRK